MSARIQPDIEIHSVEYRALAYPAVEVSRLGHGAYWSMNRWRCYNPSCKRAWERAKYLATFHWTIGESFGNHHCDQAGR